MIDEHLLEYVKKQSNAGFSREDISKVLIKSGWDTNDINSAFATLEIPIQEVSTNPVIEDSQAIKASTQSVSESLTEDPAVQVSKSENTNQEFEIKIDSDNSKLSESSHAIQTQGLESIASNIPKEEVTTIQKEQSASENTSTKKSTMKFSNLFRNGWRLYKERIAGFIAIGSVYFVVRLIVELSIKKDLSFMLSNNQSTLVTVSISILAIIIAIIVTTVIMSVYMYLSTMDSREVSFKEALKKSFMVFLPIVWVSIVNIGVVMGALLFYVIAPVGLVGILMHNVFNIPISIDSVPGLGLASIMLLGSIIVFTMFESGFVFSVWDVITNRARGFEALVSSENIVHGRIMNTLYRLFGIGIVYGLATIPIAFITSLFAVGMYFVILMMPSYAFLADVSGLITSSILWFYLYLFITPLVITTISFLYNNIRETVTDSVGSKASVGKYKIYFAGGVVLALVIPFFIGGFLSSSLTVIKSTFKTYQTQQIRVLGGTFSTSIEPSASTTVPLTGQANKDDTVSNDYAIKSSIDALSVSTNMYYNSNNQSYGIAKSCDTGFFKKDKITAKYIKKINLINGNKTICRANGDHFIVYSPLSYLGYCLDDVFGLYGTSTIPKPTSYKCEKAIKKVSILFTDPVYKYSLITPYKWSNVGTKSVRSFKSPTTSAEFNIINLDNHIATSANEEFIKTIMIGVTTKLKSTYSSFKILGSSKPIVSGVQAREVLYSFSNSAKKQKLSAIYLIHGNYAYVLMTTSLDKDWEKSKPIFNKILKSFSFI